jgi:hypothetical protein
VPLLGLHDRAQALRNQPCQMRMNLGHASDQERPLSGSHLGDVHRIDHIEVELLDDINWTAQRLLKTRSAARQDNGGRSEVQLARLRFPKPLSTSLWR